VLVELARGLIRLRMSIRQGMTGGLQTIWQVLERMGVEARVDAVGDNRATWWGCGKARQITNIAFRTGIWTCCPGQGWTVEPFAGVIEDGSFSGAGRWI